MDDGYSADAVALDFAKAFESVNNSYLLAKLVWKKSPNGADPSWREDILKCKLLMRDRMR